MDGSSVAVPLPAGFSAAVIAHVDPPLALAPLRLAGGSNGRTTVLAAASPLGNVTSAVGLAVAAAVNAGAGTASTPTVASA